MPKKQQKKLNICHIGHKRVPSREGGIEIVVEELAIRMVERGHNVVCYNRKGHHVSGKEFDKLGLSDYKGVKLKTVFTINGKGLAAMTSSFSAAVRAAFGRYDVVHFHAEGPCAMLWIPKFFGKRCIATIHGIDWQREKWKNGFGSKYIKFGEKVAVKYADEIIVLSKGVREYFKDAYDRETILVPNGVSKPQLKNAELITEKFGLEKDSYILFLGRIVPEKGIRYLIKAFKQVNTGKKLVIAGGASDTEAFMSELQIMAKEDDRILFTGFVEGQILEELYSNAYVYVLPSDLEGMPLSLLEAMSFGNCCVVSDISECTDVIENKGIIFEKGNIKELTGELQCLCDKSDVVMEYKNNAANFICEKYNWEDVVDKTINIYQNGEIK